MLQASKREVGNQSPLDHRTVAVTHNITPLGNGLSSIMLRNQYGESVFLVGLVKTNDSGTKTVSMSQDNVRAYRDFIARSQRPSSSTDSIASALGSSQFLASPTTLESLQSPSVIKQWFKNTLTKIFLETYPPDGYDVIQKSNVNASPWSVENNQPLGSHHLTLGLVLATFFGLPTRLDEHNRYTFKQFLKNLIGGWNSVPIGSNGKKLWSEKYRWQYFLIPVKFLVIAPLKLLSIPAKFLINLLKVVTELCPMMMRELLLPTYNSVTSKLATMTVTSYYSGLLRYRFFKGLALIGYFLFVVWPVATAYYLATFLHLLGRAVSSPLKSMTMAFHFGRQFEKYGTGAYYFSYFLAGILAGMSLSISAFYWAFYFPVMIGAAFAYVPALLQAVTWVSQLPVISNLLTVVNAVLGWVSTFPVMVNYIVPGVAQYAVSIGLEISATVIVTGAALGYAMAFVASGINYVADKLSNAWTVLGWNNTKMVGPLTALANLASLLMPGPHQYSKLPEPSPSGTTPQPTPAPTSTGVPSAGATGIVNRFSASVSDATTSAASLESTAGAVERDHYEPPTGAPTFQDAMAGTPAAAPGIGLTAGPVDYDE